MKRIVLFLSTLLFIGSGSVSAETPAESSSSRSGAISTDRESVMAMSRPTQLDGGFRPFTRGASMQSISSLGFQVQIATNLNGRMNLRSGIDALYWKKWVTYGGFTAPAVVQMVSNDMSLDFYPFPKRAFRISPGIVVHNRNAATSTIQLAPVYGGAFILNGHTYYSRYTPSSNPDPRLPAPGPEPARTIEGLQLRKTAFTLTTGWGNIIHRTNRGPWSFPFEAGVAFLGAPIVKPVSIDGQICDAQLENCRDASSDPDFNRDLQAHFAPFKSHLDLLKAYPIVKFGLAYSFAFRTIR